MVTVESVTSDKDSATICEEVTFTVTTAPADYASLIEWTSTGGCSPASQVGGATFATKWPCIGSKQVTASCCGNLKSKTITVVLPEGCFSGDKSTTLLIIKTGNLEGCDIEEEACGLTEHFDEIITAVFARYNNCFWEFQVGGYAEIAAGPCPYHYRNIETGDDPRIDRWNYCGIIDIFVNQDGCRCTDGYRWSNTNCVQIHEDEHFAIFQEQLALYEAVLNAKDSTCKLPVSCEQFPSCKAALALQESEIIADIKKAYEDAWAGTAAVGEDRPVAAARPCFEAIARSICERAKNEGWLYCEDCNDVGVPKW